MFSGVGTAHAVAPGSGLQRRVAVEDTLLKQEEHRTKEALQTEEDIPECRVLLVPRFGVHHPGDRRAADMVTEQEAEK